jgi:hypothetical protein
MTPRVFNSLEYYPLAVSFSLRKEAPKPMNRARPFQKNKSSKIQRMFQGFGYFWQILNSGTSQAHLFYHRTEQNKTFLRKEAHLEQEI